MRWKTGRRSSNIEDRRGGRMTGRKVKGGGIGIILLALVGMYFGIFLYPWELSTAGSMVP